MTVHIEIDQEIAAKLQAIAATQKLTLQEYLARIAFSFPVLASNGGREDRTPYELVEDLIGVVDSSVPSSDPAAQPRHTQLGQILAEKFRKQGLNIP